MRDVLHIGFFEDFKGHNSVLFSGDSQAMANLAGLCRDLASGVIEQMQLEALPYVVAHRGLSILADRVKKSKGLQYAAKDAHWTLAPQEPKFNWRLSPHDWETVSLFIEPLEKGSGHQYLDYFGVLDDAQLMVSSGEYDEDWWREHG